MFRRVFLATLLTAAASLAASESASGAIISARNPYRSFNISGINYGSMQWERTHRGGRATVHRGGWLFRRR